MASSKDYLSFIMEKLARLDEITFRKMMGEYLIYYNKKLVAYIFDNRLMVKPVESATLLMPYATREIPYKNAKELLVVDNVDDCDFLEQVIKGVYNDLIKNESIK